MSKVVSHNGDRRPYRADRGTDPTRLCRWLDEQMQRRRTNQFALAGRSGVSQGYINGILHRRRLPGDDKIRMLADALGAKEEDALDAVWLDRIERMVEKAPKHIRALFRRAISEV